MDSAAQMGDGGAEDASAADGGIAKAMRETRAARAGSDAKARPDAGDDPGTRSSMSGAAGAGGANQSSSAGSNCGDGVVQSPEICDPGSASMPCPVACVDSNPCTEDVLTGSAASCSSECKHNPITKTVADDGCCPPGATPSTDNDCAPSCTAVDEICDGKDNDCDGNADEGVRNDCGGCAALSDAPGQSCSSGESDCKVVGMFECDGKDKVRCSAVAGQTLAEVCDSKDNDCDGRVDEGVLNACKGCGRLEHAPGESCSAGMGACKGAGVYECDGTEAVSCGASARTPTREVCDGEDNDCNGAIDDGAGKMWYQDCDSDGYPPQGAGQEACSQPAPTNGCPWIERAPGAGATDCDDQNEVRHPGAAFGLPISRVGQTLPPANDPAYDLNCDGTLTRSGGALATGKFKQGQLEVLDLCPEQFMCSGGGPYCVLSFPIPGGGAVCGQPYRTSAPCFGDLDVYVQCQ